MVAFIQGTWLYLSGIQADEAQLAIFDSGMLAPSIVAEVLEILQ